MKWLLAFIMLLWALPVHAEQVAIVNAHLMDGSHNKTGMTIILSDGKIVSVESSGKVPAGARIVDAVGRAVTPSLNAAATQIGIADIGAAADTEDSDTASGPIGAALDIALAVDRNALTIQEARAQGVASAMVFPSAGNGVFAGQGASLHLDPEMDLVRLPRTALFAVSTRSYAGGSRAAAWTLIRNALDEAMRTARQKDAARGKLLNPADLKALRPVVAGRVPLAISANREADIRQAMTLARDYGIRVVIIGGAEAWRIAGSLSTAKIPVILDPLDELPFNYDAVGARRDNAAILAKAGVRIAFMVSGQTIYLSYNLGPALREGAGIAAANGLSRANALRAITVGPSQVWTGIASPGIAVGAPADLVIWDGDPLEPSSAPVHVFLGGREMSQVTRQTLLRDRYHPARMNADMPPAYRK